MSEVSPDATADLIRHLYAQQEQFAREIASLAALVQKTNERFTEQQRLVQDLLERSRAADAPLAPTASAPPTGETAETAAQPQQPHNGDQGLEVGGQQDIAADAPLQPPITYYARVAGMPTSAQSDVQFPIDALEEQEAQSRIDEEEEQEQSKLQNPKSKIEESTERVKLPALWIQGLGMAQAVTEAAARDREEAGALTAESLRESLLANDAPYAAPSSWQERDRSPEHYGRAVAILGALACAGVLAAWVYKTVGTSDQLSVGQRAVQLHSMLQAAHTVPNPPASSAAAPPPNPLPAVKQAPDTSNPSTTKGIDSPSSPAAGAQESQIPVGGSNQTTDHRPRSPLPSELASDKGRGAGVEGGPETLTSKQPSPARSAVAANLNPALLTAVLRQNPAIVDNLLQSGADVNARNANGSTALMLAAREGATEVIKALLAHGAKVDAQNSTGWTALMMAALMDHPTTAQLLLDAGANVNMRNYNGGSALMLAAQAGSSAVASDLLAHQADPNARNQEGDTALKMAMQHHHSGIAAMLRRAGETQ